MYVQNLLSEVTVAKGSLMPVSVALRWLVSSLMLLRCCYGVCPFLLARVVSESLNERVVEESSAGSVV